MAPKRHRVEQGDSFVSSGPHNFDPGSREDCVDLGTMQLADRTAVLYVCDDLVIACFSDPPGGVLAQHMYRLTFESDVFLLAAFRMYLDHVGKAPMPSPDVAGDAPLEC